MLEAKANTGTGLDKLATDLVAGEHIPLNKLVTGGLGTNGGPVTLSNPLPVGSQLVDSTGASLLGGTGGLKTEGVTEVTQVNYLGSALSPTNRLPVENSIGRTPSSPAYTTIVDNQGTIISAFGSLAVSGATSLLLNSNPASVTNAVPSQLVTAGAVVSSANPLPSKLAIGGEDVSATNPLFVSQPNAPVLTTTALSTINTSLLNGGLNAAGWVDVGGAAELSVLVLGSAGITAGQIIFEGTNDPAETIGIPLPYDEPSVLANRNLLVVQSIAANARRAFRVATYLRYVRVRISTAFVGGTVGARSYLDSKPYVPSTLGVNATIQGTPSVAVSSVVQTVAGVTLEGSAARLTSGVGTTVSQNNARGISVVHNISVLTGGTTPTVQLRLQVLDPVSSIWVDVPGGTLPVRNAVGTFVTMIYPGLSAATDIINMAIPRVFRFAWNITGVPTGCTFSVGGNYII
jgi:hypothetical protein